MTDPAAGLLDTSVVIDHDVIDPAQLPLSTAIASITLAELAAGPHATGDPVERGPEAGSPAMGGSDLGTLPFDAECARAYGRLYATLRASGRPPRTRVADLLIAATALAYGLPLYTRNPDDLQVLRPLVQVVTV